MSQVHKRSRHLFRASSAWILAIAIALISVPSIAASPGMGSLESRVFEQASPEELTVANWSFRVNAAVKSQTFSNEIHLGALEDGRHWLAVTLTGTNTSGESQSIHSDQIQLRTRSSELIKQTGAESESAADELGYMSIGGSFGHTIDANETIEIVQIYKVEPGAESFTLVFDFSGEWTLPITELVNAANGDPTVLSGSVPGDPSATTNSQSNPWTVSTTTFEITLVGAVTSKTFSGPFHLGNGPDGNHWLVISFTVRNLDENDDHEFESDMITLQSVGDTVFQSGDESNSVAGELGLSAPSEDIDPGEEKTLVQVYQIKPNVLANTLVVSENGSWYIDLQSVIEAADGNPEVVHPDTAIDLSELEVDQTVAQAIPTPAPTPTPEPTAVPDEGSSDRPAAQGETLFNGPWIVEISDVEMATSLNYGYETPRPGYKFVLITILIANGGDSGNDFGSGDFILVNPMNDEEYSSEFLNFAPTPLEGGRLGAGEYTYGQLVYEVPTSADTATLRFRPSIFGDESFWTIIIP